MDQTEIIDFTREALVLTLQLAAPIMLIGLVVGVIIALVQALTQIQEMTLAFVPKILAIFGGMFLLFPLFAQLMTDFTEKIADKIVSMS